MAFVARAPFSCLLARYFESPASKPLALGATRFSDSASEPAYQKATTPSTSLPLARAASRSACASSSAQSGQQRASRRCVLPRLCSRAIPLHARPAHSPAPARVTPRAPPCASPRALPRLALYRALCNGHVMKLCGLQPTPRGGRVLGRPLWQPALPPERLSPLSAQRQRTEQQYLHPTSITSSFHTITDAHSGFERLL